MLRTTQVHEQRPLTSNQLQTLQVNGGGKIHSLIVSFTNNGAPATEANIRSSITDIRLTFNGKEIVKASAAELYDLYETIGVNVFAATGVNGALELNVGPLLFTDPAVRRVLGYGTRNINSIQVQITCGTLTDITAAQCFTERTVTDEILGVHCKFLQYPVNFNATGEHTVDTLPRDPSTNYLMVMASMGASGTIDRGDVKLNNATIVDQLPRHINSVLCSNKRFSQLAGYYLYNFVDGGFNIPAVGLQMLGAADLRFKQNFSVAPGAGGYRMLALTMENIPTQLSA